MNLEMLRNPTSRRIFFWEKQPSENGAVPGTIRVNAIQFLLEVFLPHLFELGKSQIFAAQYLGPLKDAETFMLGLRE